MPMPRRKNAIHSKLRKALALVIASRKLITHKLSQLSKKNKKYNKLFLRHYNYSYIGEYQFSPSSTPLISHRYSHGGFLKKRRSRVLYLLFCGGSGMESMIETNFEFGDNKRAAVEEVEWNGGDSDGRTGEERELEGLLFSEENRRAVGEVEWNGGDSDGRTGEERELEGEEEEEEIDGRAQKFIERFYEEIRLERQRSFIQWKEMLQRSC